MSTPSDNKPMYEQTAEGTWHFLSPSERKPAQPSPAAVEQALTQEKANQEKIGATVQAARASATQQLFERVTEPVSADDYNALVATLQSTIESLGDQLINRTKQQRHVLQAEVNYYKQAHKNDVRQLGQTIDRLSRERDALQAQRDELLDALKLLETGARRFANGSDNMPSYVLALCVKAKAAIARATKGGTGQ